MAPRPRLGGQPRAVTSHLAARRSGVRSDRLASRLEVRIRLAGARLVPRHSGRRVAGCGLEGTLGARPNAPLGAPRLRVCAGVRRRPRARTRRCLPARVSQRDPRFRGHRSTALRRQLVVYHGRRHSRHELARRLRLLRSYGAAFDRDFDQTLLAASTTTRGTLRRTWSGTQRYATTTARPTCVVSVVRGRPFPRPRANDWLSFAVEQLLGEVRCNSARTFQVRRQCLLSPTLRRDRRLGVCARAPAARALAERPCLQLPHGYAQRLEDGGVHHRLFEAGAGSRRSATMTAAEFLEGAPGVHQGASRGRCLGRRKTISITSSCGGGGLVSRADFARLGAGSWEGKVVARVSFAELPRRRVCRRPSDPAATRVSARRPIGRGDRASEAATGPSGARHASSRPAGRSREGLSLRLSELRPLAPPLRRLLFSRRCGPPGQTGRGGHSARRPARRGGSPSTVSIGSPIGSYLYTLLPARRNSTDPWRHFTPYVEGREPSRSTSASPARRRPPRPCAIFWGEGFVGQHGRLGAARAPAWPLERGADGRGFGRRWILAAPAAPRPFSRGYGCGATSHDARTCTWSARGQT